MGLLLLKYVVLCLIFNLMSDYNNKGTLDSVDAATTSACKADGWECDDGTCIDAKFKCNGALNCPDGSDESFLLCRNAECNGHTCVYGGCVHENATCNGVKDCADNSDELLPECRNDLVYSACISAQDREPNLEKRQKDCFLKESTCTNGQEHGRFIKCDGKVDCDDGSDETVESCAGSWIPNCIGWKFRCKYGGCLDYSRVCNGVIDCADGSDELDGLCDLGNSEEFKKKGEWNCKDGNRINESLKCNGAVDCLDGSDETFVLCYNYEMCPFGYRKCVYGSCVRNSAFCNGVMDCADNSDELQLECRNETTYLECTNYYKNFPDFEPDPIKKQKYENLLEKCKDVEKLCDNGQILNNERDKCNGKIDCEDGSDESIENCATDRDWYNCGFRCESGGCIALSKVCDKKKDCADGSDEHDGLCFVGKCVLPEFPKHGNYTVLEQPDVVPGQLVDVALLVYSCESGYLLHGTSRYVNCLKGNWPFEPPKCLAQCHLEKQPGTTYWCLSRGPFAGVPEKECRELVPDGATVRPECSDSIYQYTGVLSFMHCIDGVWDQAVPSCSAQCGLLTSQGDKLIINGTSAERGELPWHAAIYDKTKSPYEQICGGSLISQTIVISAAHCFWSDFRKLLPVRNYAVALGKLHRPWNDPNEVGVQKFTVRSIKVPPRYRGSAANYQEDIALVILSTPAEYRSYVLPVCLDFGPVFERMQLSAGIIGKVAGWGLTSEDGKASPVLKVAQLPYLDIDSCYDQSPPEFHKFITGDKFCAGNGNSSALCKGDSGGGLVFPSTDRDETRYFLRGVVSTAPRNDHMCNANAHTTFTLVSKHQAFILEYWN